MTPRRDGFSLIELVVVVLLIGALTSIIAPSFTVQPRHRAEDEARRLVSSLEMARSRALAQRQRVRVSFDFDASGDGYTAWVDHDRDGDIDEVEAERDSFPAFGSIALHRTMELGRGNADPVPGDAGSGAVTLTDNELDFSIQGVPDPWGTMGTIYLVAREDRDAVSAVSVAASGAVRTWTWDGDAWN